MKKIFIIFLATVITTSSVSAGQATVTQQPLEKSISFSNSMKSSLTKAQKLEIASFVAKAPATSTLACTGMVQKGATKNQIAIAQKRANEVCLLAKRLNRDLSTKTGVQVANTKNSLSKVILTLEPANSQSSSESDGEFQTDAFTWDLNPNYIEGEKCAGGFGGRVIGRSKSGEIVFLGCRYASPGQDRFFVDNQMPAIDQASKRPIVSQTVPEKTLFTTPANLYYRPPKISDIPKAETTVGDFKDYGKCKLKEGGDGSPDKSFGFPLPLQRERLKPNFKILVVPVQFTDFPATSAPGKDFADVQHAVTSFYTRASSVPISFDWTIPESYYKMNRSIESFQLKDWSQQSPGGFYFRYEPYIEAALALADADYNFLDFDAVIVEEPRSVPNSLNPMFVPHVPENGGIHMDTIDGEVNSLLISGNDELRDISNWVHEFGHLLGLGDAKGTQAAFDIMFGSYTSMELSAWNRWLLGILKDSQVDCKTDSQRSVHWLRPVAWQGDHKKALVIPVGQFQALVVESRRRIGYDVLLGRESEGAYVYRVNTSASMYNPGKEKIVDVIAPARSSAVMDRWRFDAALKVGESVESDGWKITVLESGPFGDIVEVTRP